MSVPEVFILQAWEKSGGQCECHRSSHSHTYGRCTRRIVYEKRGSRGHGGWAPRYRVSPATNKPIACEVLCMDCFEQASNDEFKT